MSYQVLARKWRPKSFESLVGQEHVVRSLTHALTDQRLHHAYLFTGTRGVGKTTLARILAKSLNCETGITATPCGTCASCAEIDAGRFVDLLEVDAATNTKADEMRQLLENAVYAPTRGRYKVYVIDEVHMLSGHAFNAMLKTLEEPPEHVKFILATTDPQKIPVTVLSRCLQFNLKQMTPSLISAHLKRILEAEGISAEAGALHLLSRSAAGSMRDALSLLDQAIAHGAGKVDEAQVRTMLGTVDLDYLFSVIDALLAGDAAGLMRIAEEMALRSLSFDSALQELAVLFTRMQVAQLAPQSVADDLPERERILHLAAGLDPEFVQLGYQIAIHGRRELSLAPDEQSGFIMTLLRLHAFRPDSAEKAGQTDADPTKGKNAVSRPPPVAPVSGRDSPVSANMSSRAVPEGAGKTVGAERAAFTGGAGSAGDWQDVLDALKVGGMARELGQHCLLRSIEEKRVVLALSQAHRHLQMESVVDKLQEALCQHFGRPLQLVIELEEVPGVTPAAAAQLRQQARQDRAVANIEQDGFVREAVELFDATIVESSIKPV